MNAIIIIMLLLSGNVCLSEYLGVSNILLNHELSNLFK